MAKKAKNKKQVQQEVVLDNYARILQIVAIIAVVVVVVVDQLTPTSDIPIWVPAGLLGVAVGLSPDQIADIIKSIFRGKR
ncbi:MAG TPA: hypothetical protein VD907_07000 [Verrucomicrobiae bacterium]|nr:hypothetical protein [Verrucomicrobiae bacterium]